MDELEAKFEEETREICRQARVIRYNPVRFEQMLSEYGALSTARRLLDSDRFHDGFTRLWQEGRLDISLECCVLKPVFRRLFTDQQLNVARRRLRELDFDPTICERE